MDGYWLLDATLLLLHEVFPYKRYGKSCITDMTLMLLAARESHPLLALTCLYRWMTINHIHEILVSK